MFLDFFVTKDFLNIILSSKCVSFKGVVYNKSIFKEQLFWDMTISMRKRLEDLTLEEIMQGSSAYLPKFCC